MFKKIHFFLFIFVLLNFHSVFAANQCNDGLDNDGDELIDKADPDCSSLFDNDEGCTIREKEPNNWYDIANQGASVDCSILTIKGMVDSGTNKIDYYKLRGGFEDKGLFDSQRDIAFSLLSPQEDPYILDAYYALRSSAYGYVLFKLNDKLLNDRLRPYISPLESRSGFLIFGGGKPNSKYELNITNVGKTRRPKQKVFVKLADDLTPFGNEQFKLDIFNEIKSHFESYGYGETYIDFSLSPFSSTDYSTITLTASDTTVVRKDYSNDTLKCRNRISGIAEHVDRMNYLPKGQVLVCIHRIPSTNDYGEKVNFIGKIASHELGHLLGLSHTQDNFTEFLPLHDDIMAVDDELLGIDVNGSDVTFSTSVSDYSFPRYGEEQYRLVQKADDILKALHQQDN